MGLTTEAGPAGGAAGGSGGAAGPARPLHVRRSGRIGRGSAPTLVLLHGFGDNGGTWTRVTPQLNRYFDVVAMDLPGFGNSDSRGLDGIFDGYVEAVIGTLDELGIDEPVSIMGNSLGSLTALLVATKHPERVSRVVLTALPGVVGVPHVWRRVTSRQAARISGRIIRTVPQPLLQRAFVGIFIRGACAGGAQHNRRAALHLAPDYAKRDRLLSLLPLAPKVLRELAQLSVVELVSGLDAAGVPALLVWGELDRVTPARHRRAFALAQPPVSIELVAEAGHCPQLDRPRRLLDVVLPFLRDESLERSA